MTKHVMVVIGTRPEAIKMAPVINALRRSTKFKVTLCVTAQHRDMLDQVLSLFDLAPEIDLNLMSAGQTLEKVSALILEKLSIAFDEYRPDLVLVHGDTTTTAMASLASFYKRIPVGHIEAGLRTNNILSPWPEELNRRITTLVSSLHFAPTKASFENLTSENIPVRDIEITGNTVIDALESISSRLDSDSKLTLPLDQRFSFLDPEKKMLLVTGHRRENFGSGVQELCKALSDLGEREDLQVVFAVHLNPNVKAPVEQALSDARNVYLIPPQDYLSFVYLMKRSHVVLTDSGGIQEEAPSLGKPVLVMRENTERPEAVEAGTAKLIGAKAINIVSTVNSLLDNPALYQQMASVKNPYGDGLAADRIVQRVERFMESNT